jgi:hypothetical protein
MKRKDLIFIFLISLFSFMETNAQLRPAENRPRIVVKYLKSDFSINELENKAWKKAETVTIDKYWSGEPAPEGRRFKARLLWSETAVYVYFEANQQEPLVISETANLTTKTRGLWDRDVCEIFLAPDKETPRKYFEFEIAPNGEWIDLGIHQMPDRRETDWDYASGMQSKSLIEKDKIRMAIKVEWKAFGKTPKAGDVWLGNIFRCIGKDPTRGYLAWSPTLTKEPSFHVPEKFGEFEFVK